MDKQLLLHRFIPGDTMELKPRHFSNGNNYYQQLGALSISYFLNYSISA